VLSTEHTHFYSDNMNSHLHLSYLFQKYARESFTFITFTPAKSNTGIIAFVLLKLNWLQRCKNKTKQNKTESTTIMFTKQAFLQSQKISVFKDAPFDSLYPYEGCVASSGRRTS
jgi:hypothetical protein